MGDAPKPPAPTACYTPGIGYYCYPFSPYMPMYPPYPPPPLAPTSTAVPGNQIVLKTASPPAAPPSASPPHGLFMGQFIIPRPPSGPAAPPPPPPQQAHRAATLTSSEEEGSIPNQIKFVACHHCSLCGRARSHAYHKENPLIPGVITPSTKCRRCTKKAAAKKPNEIRVIEISDRRAATSRIRSRSRSRTRITVEYSDHHRESPKPAPPPPPPPTVPPPHNYRDYYYRDLSYRQVYPQPPQATPTAAPPAPAPVLKSSSPQPPRETRIIYRRYESPPPPPTRPTPAPTSRETIPVPAPSSSPMPRHRSPARDYETYRFEHTRSPSRRRYYSPPPLSSPRAGEHPRGRSPIRELDRYSFRHTRSPSVVSRRYYSPPPKVRFEQTPSPQPPRGTQVARDEGGYDASDSHTRTFYRRTSYDVEEAGPRIVSTVKHRPQTFNQFVTGLFPRRSEIVRLEGYSNDYGAYHSYHMQATSPPPSPLFGHGGIPRDELGPWFQPNPEPDRNVAYSERGVDGSNVKPWWDDADESVTSVNGEYRTYVDVRDEVSRDTHGRYLRELVIEETTRLPDGSHRRHRSKRY